MLNSPSKCSERWYGLFVNDIQPFSIVDTRLLLGELSMQFVLADFKRHQISWHAFISMHNRKEILTQQWWVWTDKCLIKYHSSWGTWKIVLWKLWRSTPGGQGWGHQEWYQKWQNGKSHMMINNGSNFSRQNQQRIQDEIWGWNESNRPNSRKSGKSSSSLAALVPLELICQATNYFRCWWIWVKSCWILCQPCLLVTLGKRSLMQSLWQIQWEKSLSILTAL